VSGAFHYYHGESEWFDVDDAVSTIVDALEKIERARYADDNEARGLLNDAADTLRAISFVQIEEDARNGLCDCGTCEEEREEREEAAQMEEASQAREAARQEWRARKIAEAEAACPF